MKMAGSILRRFSFGAKKSSFAKRTTPPSRSEARSTRSVKCATSALPARKQPAADRSRGIRAAVEHFLASDERRLDDARKDAAGVRRHLVPVADHRSVHGELLFRIPNDEVRI